VLTLPHILLPPMNERTKNLMMVAPSEVSPKQMREYSGGEAERKNTSA
jgi:aspartyl-tRNA synthetase